MRVFCLFALSVLICSCNREKLTIVRFATPDYILVDTEYKPRDLIASSQETDYPIYYIGPVKDTIEIGPKYRQGYTSVPSWPKRFFCSRRYNSLTLKIEVDTAHWVTDHVGYSSADGKEDSSKNYYARLITIKNISDSIVWMGETFSVYFLHLEYRDPQGNWEEAGKSLAELGICGTLQPRIYLKPGEMILSKMALHRRGSIAYCRLAFGYEGNMVYSNVFRESAK